MTSGASDTFLTDLSLARRIESLEARVCEAVIEAARGDPAGSAAVALGLGGGTLFVADRTAAICGTATPAEFRRRGVQSAVVHALLEAATAAGCTLACATTLPGSTSQRNFERQGFKPAYTRAILVKTWR